MYQCTPRASSNSCILELLLDFSEHCELSEPDTYRCVHGMPGSQARAATKIRMSYHEAMLVVYRAPTIDKSIHNVRTERWVIPNLRRDWHNIHVSSQEVRLQGTVRSCIQKLKAR